MPVKSARARRFTDLEAKKQSELKNMREKEKLEKERKKKASKKVSLKRSILEQNKLKYIWKVLKKAYFILGAAAERCAGVELSGLEFYLL